MNGLSKLNGVGYLDGRNVFGFEMEERAEKRPEYTVIFLQDGMEKIVVGEPVRKRSGCGSEKTGISNAIRIRCNKGCVSVHDVIPF